MSSSLIWLVSIPVGLMTLNAAAIVLLQNKLIYTPFFPLGSRKNVKIPKFVEEVNLGDLNLWQIDNNQNNTLLYFPGNSGNLSHSSYIFDRWRKHSNIIAVHYRGYGSSKGSPSERGIKEDAQKVVNYAKSLDRNNLFLYGHSLGGAVAIHSAVNNPGVFKGLILENTFTSMRGILQDMPLLKQLSPFLWNEWDSKSLIHKVDCPVLFLVGGKDFIPKSHSVQLCELCKGELVEYPHAAHDVSHDLLPFIESSGTNPTLQ